jgi:hypothetical protein
MAAAGGHAPRPTRGAHGGPWRWGTPPYGHLVAVLSPFLPLVMVVARGSCIRRQHGPPHAYDGPTVPATFSSTSSVKPLLRRVTKGRLEKAELAGIGTVVATLLLLLCRLAPMLSCHAVVALGRRGLHRCGNGGGSGCGQAIRLCVGYYDQFDGVRFAPPGSVPLCWSLALALVPATCSPCLAGVLGKYLVNSWRLKTKEQAMFSHLSLET